MRDHPDNIRSVILDGVLPLQPGLLESEYFDIATSLRALFDACKSDDTCDTTFPNLEDVFYETMDRFDADPVTVKDYDDEGNELSPEPLDGYNVMNLVVSSLHNEQWIPYVPFLIYQLRKGDPEIADGWSNSFSFSGVVPSENLGATYAVLCSDDTAFNDPEKVTADREAHPRFVDPESRPFTLSLCELWGARPNPIEDQPVVSNIPTLLLSGEFDPATPPYYAEMAGETLSNSQHVVVPHAGHGVGVDTACGRRIVEQFLEYPGIATIMECLMSDDPIEFSTGIYLNKGPRTWFSRWSEPKAGPDPVDQLAGLFLFYLSTIIAWPIVFVVSTVRKSPSSTSAWAGRARVVAGLATVVNWAFWYWVAHYSMAGDITLNFGFHSWVRPFFIIPYLTAIAAAFVVYLAYRAWRERWWSWFGRLHYTLVALSLVSFTWFLSYWEFIGP